MNASQKDLEIEDDLARGGDNILSVVLIGDILLTYLVQRKKH
jgi:hypothetical protein